ncbi:phospholipase D-like domain-containing protein [Patescibacteria group bacterium]|nr:phospholipase D-like domain-containing protein [Patescibacteria group bacterium]
MTDVKMFPQKEISLNATPYQSGYYDRLQELISLATSSILFCQYVFSVSETRYWQRSNKILNSIFAAHLRGIEIKVLFDRPRPHSPNLRSNINTFYKLNSKGIDVRCLTVLRTLHIKMIIFDQRVFLAGSHNLTDSSLYSPFELTFECRDDFLVNSAISYFNCLFNGSLSEPFENSLKALGDGKS